MKDYFAYLQIRFLLVPRNYLRDDKAAGSEGGFPRRTRRNVGNCDCMPPVTSIVLPFGQDRKKRVPVIAEHRWLELFHPSVALYVRQRLPRWIFHSCIHTYIHIYTLLLFLSSENDGEILRIEFDHLLSMHEWARSFSLSLDQEEILDNL